MNTSRRNLAIAGVAAVALVGIPGAGAMAVSMDNGSRANATRIAVDTPTQPAPAPTDGPVIPGPKPTGTATDQPTIPGPKPTGTATDQPTIPGPLPTDTVPGPLPTDDPTIPGPKPTDTTPGPLPTDTVPGPLPTDGPTIPGPRPTDTIPGPLPTDTPVPTPPQPTDAPTPPAPGGAGQHGDAPSETSIVKDGAYTLGTAKVTYGTLGSAGGTIYYPTNGKPGEKFAGIVTMPGYMEPGAVMDVYGKRMASHGFVVMVADTYVFLDRPEVRAKAALGAIKALQANKEVADKLDGSKMALIGHSMGGGGVLQAAEQADLKAVIAVHPWAQKTFAGVTEPTMVIGGGIDNVAPVAQHATPIFGSLTSASWKGYLVKLAGTHWAGTVDDPQIMGRNLAFLKVQVDGDERYRSFLCAPAQAGTTYKSSC